MLSVMLLNVSLLVAVAADGPRADNESVSAAVSAPASPVRPQFSIGNTSVHLMMEAWGSPILDVLQKAGQVQERVHEWTVAGGNADEVAPLMKQRDAAIQAHEFDRADKIMDEILLKIGHDSELPPPPTAFDGHAASITEFLDKMDAFKSDAFPIQGVEDYIGWAVVEQEKDRWDWTPHQRAAAAIRSSGYQYIPYGWVQNLPRWAREGADYPKASLVGSGLETEALALFAPETTEAYDRFYGQMAQQLGDQIDFLRIGSPYDYGELAYPAKAGNWAFPQKNAQAGFWVNDTHARKHFQQWARQRYVALDAVNQAWQTSFSSFDALDYPSDASQQRYWLDFIDWYHDGFTQRMGELTDVVAKHLPKTQLVFSIGWPFEKVVLGQDLTGIIKMAAAKGVIVRCPTGPFVSMFYTKRMATAARHYGLKGVSSEPVDGGAPREAIAAALFKDLTTGITWHFDYLENMSRGKDLFIEYRNLYHGGWPRVDTAVFFSTSSHRLVNATSWKSDDMFAGGYPDGLIPFAEELRDLVDYEVVDERLVRDGALARYRTLVWPCGTHIEPDVLAAILDWVRDGGVWLLENSDRIEVLPAAGVSAPALPGPIAAGDALQHGAGWLYNAGGDRQALRERAGSAEEDSPFSDTLRGEQEADGVADQVWVSQFDDGLMLFNTSNKDVVKQLAPLGSEWPEQLVLPPYTIRWLPEPARPPS